MNGLTVRDLMSDRPYTLVASANLKTLYDLMDAKQVRHVPVVDEEGRVQGLASHRDLVHAALPRTEDLPMAAVREILELQTVEEVMSREPATIDPDEGIVAAGQMMMENKFGCLPVVEGDQLVGILTESDFVRYVVNNPEA